MSGGKRYFVVNGLSQIKTWLRSYSWIGVQRLVCAQHALNPKEVQVLCL